MKDSSECSVAFEDMKSYIDFYGDILLDIKDVKKYALAKEYAAYLQGIDEVFANTSINLTSIQPHVQCMAFYEEYSYLDSLMLNMTILGANISYSKTYHQAYTFAKQLPSLYKQRIQYDETKFTQMYEHVRDTCDWFEDDGLDTLDRGQVAMAELQKVKDERNTAMRHITYINELFELIYSAVTEILNPKVRLAQGYLEGNTTKIKLATEFVEQSFSTTVENLEYINQDLVSLTKTYIETMIQGRDKLQRFYQTIFNLKLPVLNNYNIYQLELIKSATASNNIVFEHMITSIENNLEENVEKLIAEIYNKLMEPMENIKENVGDPIEDVLIRIRSLTENLKEYKDSTKMDADFFVLVLKWFYDFKSITIDSYLNLNFINISWPSGLIDF